MYDYELLLNIAMLAICYVYVTLCIVVSGKASRLFGFSNKSSRKLLHVLIGNLVFLIPLFTLNSLPLNFPFFVAAPFILVTFLASPYSPARSLRTRLEGLTGITGEGHRLGLFYYAVSYTFLALLFASKPYVIAAGVLPMAFGDAAAAIVGEKYGKHQYHVFTKKSLEGSSAMFLVVFLGLEASFALFSMFYSLPILMFTVAALGIGATTTLVEALSPLGFDNISVPMLGALIFLLLTGGL